MDGVAFCQSNILRKVVFYPVNLSESVGNLLRKLQIFMDRRGQGLAEFALVLPVFILLLFALIDLGRWYWVRETLENAVRQAGRYAVTGQNSGTNRVASIIQVAENATAGLGNTTVVVNSYPVDHPGEMTNNFAGYGGENVYISISTTLALYTPGIAQYFGTNGDSTISVAVTFRNESFPDSQANGPN